MSAITDEHGKLGGNGPAEASADRGRYFYLYEGLAKDESKSQRLASPEYFANLHQLATDIDEFHSPLGVSSKVSAVYTYFGQFVNHDLSAPTVTPAYTDVIRKDAALVADAIESQADLFALMQPKRPPGPAWLVDNILNQHALPLSLNSLYGAGPIKGSDEIKSFYDLSTMKFVLGRTIDLPEGKRTPTELDKMLKDDIFREGKVAKIADRRNDENVVLSQLHLAFMLFHNRTVSVLDKPGVSRKELFQAARTLVTRHYHHCIFNDYLKTIVPDTSWGKNINLPTKGIVPFEFTTAAFRFGHSMISSQYDYNRFFGEGGIESKSADISDLFSFTSRRQMKNMPGTNGKLPTHWVIDWQRFCESKGPTGSKAEPIDVKLPPHMSDLPDTPDQKVSAGLSSIVHRNLKRGYHRFIPSGQDIAAKLGLSGASEIRVTDAFENIRVKTFLKESGFDTKTPLWIYLLCEASLKEGGQTLGPVGGSLVRGTIRELLDHASGGEVWRWKPEDSPLQLPGDRPIKDIKSFLEFAGVMKPLA
jgi:hypothetical protein